LQSLPAGIDGEAQPEDRGWPAITCVRTVITDEFQYVRPTAYATEGEALAATIGGQ
jgi:hypothetical protein